MSNENNEAAILTVNIEKFETELKKGLILEINKDISSLEAEVAQLGHPEAYAVSSIEAEEGPEAQNDVKLKDHSKAIKALLLKLKPFLLILNFPEFHFLPDSQFHQAFEVSIGNRDRDIPLEKQLGEPCKVFIKNVNEFLATLQIASVDSPLNGATVSPSSQQSDINSPFLLLPKDLIFYVASYLNINQRNRLQLVSKAFKDGVDGANKRYPIDNTQLIKNARNNIKIAIQSGDLEKAYFYIQKALEHKILLRDLLTIDASDIPRNSFRPNKSVIYPLSAISLYYGEKINPILFKIILVFNAVEEEREILRDCLQHAIKVVDVSFCRFLFHAVSMLTFITGFDKLDLSALAWVHDEAADAEKIQKKITILMYIFKLWGLLHRQKYPALYSASLPYIWNDLSSVNIDFVHLFYDFINRNRLEFDFLDACHAANQISKFLAYLELSVPAEDQAIIYARFLSRAAEIGSAELVAEIFKKGASTSASVLNASVKQAIKGLHLAVLKTISQYGFNFSCLTDRSFDPLCEFLKGEVTQKKLTLAAEIIFYLGDQGFVPKSEDSCFYKVIYYLIAKSQDPQMVAQLFRFYNAKELQLVLIYLQAACDGNHQDFILQCLKDISPKGAVEALGFACQHESLSMVRTLLDLTQDWDLDLLFNNISMTSSDCALLLIEKIKCLQKQENHALDFSHAFYWSLLRPFFDGPEAVKLYQVLLQNISSAEMEFSVKNINLSLVETAISEDRPHATRLLLNDPGFRRHFLAKIVPLAYPKKDDYDSRVQREKFAKNTAWKYAKLMIYIQGIKSMLRNLPIMQPQSLFGFNYSSKKLPGSACKSKLLASICKIGAELDDISDFQSIHKYVHDIYCALNTYLKDLKSSNDKTYLTSLGEFLGIDNIFDISEINEFSFEVVCFEYYVKTYLESLTVENNNNIMSLSQNSQ